MIALMTIEHKISPEILDAVRYIKGGVVAKINHTLEDPTPNEIEAVWELVTHHGHTNPKKFKWGKMGKKWAKSVTIH